jgi:tetratricopeptide (TPR) repeat protein
MTVRALLIAALLATSLPYARADSQARPVGASDTDLDLARRHVDEGTKLYEGGDYRRALVEFRLARALKARPELDYDIGRCDEKLDELEDAVVAYERFLASSSDVSSAAQVRERVRVLSTRIASKVAVGPDARSTGDRYGLAIGVGTTALVATAVAAGLVASVAPQFHHLHTGACATGCDPSVYSSLEARANAGYAVFGVAGALALVDVAALVIAARRSRR